jgi:hypothetical protein
MNQRTYYYFILCTLTWLNGLLLDHSDHGVIQLSNLPIQNMMTDDHDRYSCTE